MMLDVRSVEVTTLALVATSLLAGLCSLLFSLFTYRAVHRQRDALGRERQALQIELQKIAAAEAETHAAVATLTATVAEAGSQAWYWSDEWQEGEAEADADINANRVTVAHSADEMFDILEEETESCASGSRKV